MTIVSQLELIAGAMAGKVVSFPTDTVPALAVLPSKSALIFSLKKRPPDKPLILMAASLEELWPYVAGTTEELQTWQQIAQTYLPGALTLVLPASSQVPPQMNPTDPTTIGIRVPDLAIAQEILAQTGALATTSANLAGEPPHTSMQAIAAAFREVLTLDYPEIPPTAIPSTVAKWTQKGWKILRQGKIYL